MLTILKINIYVVYVVPFQFISRKLPAVGTRFILISIFYRDPLPQDELRCAPKHVVSLLVSAVALVNEHRLVENHFRQRCKWPKSVCHPARCNWIVLVRIQFDLDRQTLEHLALLRICHSLCRNYNNNARIRKFWIIISFWRIWYKQYKWHDTTNKNYV